MESSLQGVWGTTLRDPKQLCNDKSRARLRQLSGSLDTMRVKNLYCGKSYLSYFHLMKCFQQKKLKPIKGIFSFLYFLENLILGAQNLPYFLALAKVQSFPGRWSILPDVREHVWSRWGKSFRSEAILCGSLCHSHEQRNPDPHTASHQAGIEGWSNIQAELSLANSMASSNHNAHMSFRMLNGVLFGVWLFWIYLLYFNENIKL